MFNSSCKLFVLVTKGCERGLHLSCGCVQLGDRLAVLIDTAQVDCLDCRVKLCDCRVDGTQVNLGCLCAFKRCQSCVDLLDCSRDLVRVCLICNQRVQRVDCILHILDCLLCCNHSLFQCGEVGLQAINACVQCINCGCHLLLGYIPCQKSLQLIQGHTQRLNVCLVGLDAGEVNVLNSSFKPQNFRGKFILHQRMLLFHSVHGLINSLKLVCKLLHTCAAIHQITQLLNGHLQRKHILLHLIQSAYDTVQIASEYIDRRIQHRDLTFKQFMWNVIIKGALQVLKLLFQIFDI